MWKVWQAEAKRIFANKAFLFLVLAWPLLYSLLAGGILWAKVVHKIPIEVVDMDRTSLSRTLTRFFATSRSFEVVATENNPLVSKDRLLADQRGLVLIIPRGFTENLKKGKPTELRVWTNAANLIVAGLTFSEAKRIITTFAGGVQLKTLQKAGLSSRRAMELIQPVQVQIANLFNPGMNYLNYLIPGLWIALAQQFMILLGGLCFVPFKQRQEVQKILGEASSAGVFFWGKWLFYIFLGVLGFEILFRAVFPFFGVEIKSFVWEMLLASLPFCAASLSLGFVISLLAPTTLWMVKVVLLLTSPAFLMSGYTFPLDYMPTFFKALSSMYPLTPFAKIFWQLYQEGAPVSVSQSSLWHLLILLGVYIGIAALVFFKRWRKLA